MLYKFHKLLIKFFSNLIFKKEERIKFRDENYQKIEDKYYSSVKWGVSYSVWDGEELLEKSIRQIRNCVDYINVVYQKESWYGQKANDNLVEILENLKAIGLIDELIEYKVEIGLPAGIQETNKRNVGLKYALKAGVNYFMTMDADEFYITSEVENLKKSIIKKGVTHSYCSIVNYGLSPTIRLINDYSICVQTFCKINKNSKLGINKNRIATVDPTRQIKECMLSKHFVFRDINMHHMSLIRKDVARKFKNSSAINGGISYEKIKDNYKTTDKINCKDIFNLADIIKEGNNEF